MIKKERILFGTYTDDPTYSDKNLSEGVYEAYLDLNKGKLTNSSLIIKEANPTYLVTNKEDSIFTVNGHKRMGGVASYDSKYKLVDKILETGSPVCYVSIDENRQLLFGANYHKGELNSYKITNDKNLNSVESLYHSEPIGPHKNQDAPHIHFANLTPDGRLIACDLGTDRVYLYDVLKSGELNLKSIWHAKPATGPRHLVFSKNGKYVYVVGELDCSVNVLEYDKKEATLRTISKTFTIDLDFVEFNSAAAIRISNDGKYLYVSNRGENSIVVFEVSKSGKDIKEIQRVYTTGNFPRDFNINETGEFLVCGFQYSDYLNLFKIDQNTGKLSLIQDDFFVPEVVCVHFPKSESYK
ncbi:hypothetical protein BG261_04200 [Floricoccus tropicus]|uniref:6-phosphogluconolactonase n=1 Tax=Floricoccus tropicus TaxID=1859473 RepID=A0A1E8GN77_9LACT|nr:lactonase family protein [Floricoccus tropicus]OFI49083.1 hypothetical protein BG261_04200 [Floricoccus tropicus]